MANSSENKKILLAFSGGLDTSAIIPWLKEKYKADVIAYCSDLGNAPDPIALKTWAEKLGAIDFIFEDLKETFARDFAFKAVRAGAKYQDDYLLGTALGRPLIAERMAHWAKQKGAYAIAHGATGKGNDQLRFEKSWASLVPDLEVIAPWKQWSFTGRSELLAYLKERGFHMSSEEKSFSVDVNLFHRSCEGNVLEDPEESFDVEKVYSWVRPAWQVKADKHSVQIAFKDGFPISLNGENLKADELLEALNKVAGDSGIGVADLVEERANGIKSRGVYETPGGTLLHLACQSLKHLCWGRRLQQTARRMGEDYADLVYDGEWHTEAREAIDAFFDKATATLTGEVNLEIYGAQLRVASRKSPFSLYDKSSVSFEDDRFGILQHAEGYSKTTCFKNWIEGRRRRKFQQESL